MGINFSASIILILEYYRKLVSTMFYARVSLRVQIPSLTREAWSHLVIFTHPGILKNKNDNIQILPFYHIVPIHKVSMVVDVQKQVK